MLASDATSKTLSVTAGVEFITKEEMDAPPPQVEANLLTRVAGSLTLFFAGRDAEFYSLEDLAEGINFSAPFPKAGQLSVFYTTGMELKQRKEGESRTLLDNRVVRSVTTTMDYPLFPIESISRKLSITVRFVSGKKGHFDIAPHFKFD